jgi:hypothetical protein
VQPLLQTPPAAVPDDPPEVPDTPPLEGLPPVEPEPPTELAPPVVADVAQHPLVHTNEPLVLPSEHGQHPHGSRQPVLQRGGAAHPTSAQLTPVTPPVATRVVEVPPLKAAVPPKPEWPP